MHPLPASLKQQFINLQLRATAVIHRHAQPSMANELVQLGDTVTHGDERDFYGQGGIVASFEQHLCDLFAKPACIFLPTGTLAQCAALKCYSEKSGRPSVGLHPTSHLLLHEHRAIETLWGLAAKKFGDASRVVTAEDLEFLDPTSVCALIIETPMREIGGAVPCWDELERIRHWCDQHHIALHLDGARVWQTSETYQRSLADIAALFDSVYVSFYKDLGGIFGAALLGSCELITDVRVWARRAGGNPVTLYPEVLAAREGLRSYLPRMATFVEYAKRLAQGLSLSDVLTVPGKPEAAMFHLHLPMCPVSLTESLVAYAAQSSVVPLPLPRAGDATSSVCEINIGDQAVAYPVSFWVDHITACLKQAR